MVVYIVLIILGIVQGVAEFSGHLTILQQLPFFNNVIGNSFGGNILFVNVALHIATLIAVMIFLRGEITYLVTGFFSSVIKKDFKSKEMLMIYFVILASIPAGILGILLNDLFEQLFSSPLAVSLLLICNGVILILSKKISPSDKLIYQTGISRSLMIGLFQAFAIIPGISRSGMTITGSMLFGLKPEEAAKFSFLMAIPVIAGAGLLEGVKAFKTGNIGDIAVPLLFGMIITIAVSFVSIKLLFKMVKQVKLYYFGYYTIAVGLIFSVYFFLTSF